VRTRPGGGGVVAMVDTAGVRSGCACFCVCHFLYSVVQSFRQRLGDGEVRNGSDVAASKGPQWQSIVGIDNKLAKLKAGRAVQ
jgi:hypothetical protein